MSLPPLFAPQSTPRVFATPPGVDAAHALATGFRVRLGEGPPERWARCTVYLNAQRSAKAFARALRTGPAHLLPRLLTIDGLAAQQGLFAAQTPLARTLDLTALVAKLLEADPSLGVAQNAFDLAESLSALLDEMAVEGVTVAQLRTLPPDALQQHWQKSLAFLDLVTGQEARLGLGEASSVLQARAVAQQIEAWAASPPDQPVLAAGSTASRRPTADLLAAIAHLPQGAVILPGLDRTLPLDAVDQLVEAQSPTLDHPQAMMVRFLDRLGLRPSEVPLWGETALEGAPRQALISLALRPAPVTDGWLRDGPALRDTLGPATAKISLVEAPTQQAEADTLAWAIRSALHRGKTVALVSADRGLTRRVQAALLRWQIEADDSAGRPLQQTPPGVFLRLVLSALDGAPAPAILAALLKHPITATGALAESGTAEDADSTRSTHLKRV
ncbi:MAG: double-strand break repair protein AddB, partial [Pseudomonadota bacterium]